MNERTRARPLDSRKPVEADLPASAPEVEDAPEDEGELPFTGLTLVIVGLAGAVLIGGGFTIRVLASRG